MLLLLGWVFVPFYLKSGVYTMPEFLEKRYRTGARDYLSWVSIVAYVLTKISVTIAAGAIVFTALLGIEFWTGAVLIIMVFGAYTILGGLKAVVYTELMQMFILIIGAIALTIYGLAEIGGLDALVAKTDDEYLSLWRPFSDPEFPWTGIIFGVPILGVWYWCTDQFIVQRVLAAKDFSQARRGTILPVT
jgi:SSS family solute:Na+ symporter